MAEEMKNAQENEEKESPMIEGPASSQEPEPAEAGPETMAKRAAELRKKSLEAKEGREKALKAETERLEAAEKDSNEEAAESSQHPVPETCVEAGGEEESEESSSSGKSSVSSATDLDEKAAESSQLPVPSRCQR